MQEVELGQRDIRQLEPFVGGARVQQALTAAATFRSWLGERTIWNVSSTAVGGGVAEMLVPLLSYSRSLGVRIRWLIMDAEPPFYLVTKRLHHALHGSPGDGSSLDAEAARIYEATSKANAEALFRYVRPGDVALLHDPQTAGLVPPLIERGVAVIWRCHIGHDEVTDEVERGWSFIADDLRPAHAYVFSRSGYIPRTLDAEKAHIVQPSIDPMSPKNQPLDDGAGYAILHHVGLITGPTPAHGPRFMRTDGSAGKVSRRADITRHGPAPTPDTPLVVQISRWDPLKDMVGVLRAFARLVEEDRAGNARLLLAGPDVSGVTDDPEGPAVFGAAAAIWRALPERARARIDLCMLPTDDIEENAAIVNAIQRRAAVVAQKSIHEGFGLTVTEAMWKSRPVIASAVGGIRDQIDHRVHGLLLDDPNDLRTFGDYVSELLFERPVAARYGAAAREQVREKFLGVRHLLQYADILPRHG